MSPFESATRSAIEEILKSHLCESKYGYFLTKDTLETLRNELAKFLQTSRDLKSKGDSFLSKVSFPPNKDFSSQ